ncbi:hypothetical protein DFJ43DRAFT_547997 [Lentinula guzmanii]|uniref:DUF6699 domain-containing protein n=1 Tax=Lentinula guzmanii TaxID=2804957 RepID=A0AA38JES6_9AGAR|nr:hypothetical protein DFJ43DRAFT_547997 [Lentinula guzmanii]
MPTLRQISPVLSYQPLAMLEGTQNPSLLLWNMREVPSIFLRMDTFPARTLRPHELAAFATRPSVDHLHIRCGIFAESDDWHIEARNPSGVTVRDVLVAIYDAFTEPYSNEAFNTLCAKTQMMVLNSFHSRVRATVDSRSAWEAGMQRGDRLMRHFWFGGLSLPYDGGEEMENTCFLSLRRVDDQPNLSSPTRIVPSPFR